MLAEKCKVNIETIKRGFSKLQKMNIIERIGSRRSGIWKILKQNIGKK